MRRYTGAVVACLLAAVPAVRAGEKEAVRALAKLGGEAIHVGFDPKQSIFHVDFSKNARFTDAHMKAAVPHLKQIPSLRVVTVCSRAFTDKGLAHVKELKDLDELSLVMTGVTDRGIQHLKTMKNLKSVNLDLTRVTPKGAAELKKALPDVEVFLGPDKK